MRVSTVVSVASVLLGGYSFLAWYAGGSDVWSLAAGAFGVLAIASAFVGAVNALIEDSERPRPQAFYTCHNCQGQRPYGTETWLMGYPHCPACFAQAVERSQEVA